MKDEEARQGLPATTQIAALESSNGAGLQRAPKLLFAVTLEELPTFRIVADSLEDELRLRRWLRSSGARRRLLDALLDGLDEIGA
jgi:hypothetical protein